ncbi:unnamed protein product [Brassicogethes aeneus]|uniref:Peptidase C1A papain C-terminal domain-containing protein n=1 Tax=Brassicogethes aeneus TaxID=1431903 RepID=A0A9P0B761_BRAAE|nr:unnamed protein product [Brassicogethes aeneus]
MGGYLPNSSLYETSLGQVDDMVDWRKKGAVTPVKQQGQCGSCWAFSSTGALEGQHQILNNKLVSLSEQNLLDCTSSYGNMGCSGGLMTSTFKYVTDHGVTTEEKYPYTGIVGQCKQSNVVLKAKGYKEIRSNDENSLQQAVSSVGPISVAVHANTNLQSYKSGVFSDRSCSNTELNHAVLIVGYTPEYWIVKNSWGSAWGEHGYAKFRRGTNMCGIAASASFPVL